MTGHKQLSTINVLVSNLIAANSTNFGLRLAGWRPVLPQYIFLRKIFTYAVSYNLKLSESDWFSGKTAYEMRKCFKEEIGKW